jgi:hypothetical protein
MHTASTATRTLAPPPSRLHCKTRLILFGLVNAAVCVRDATVASFIRISASTTYTAEASRRSKYTNATYSTKLHQRNLLN